MKKIVVILLVVNTLLIGDRLWNAFEEAIAAEAPNKIQNGDFNGDGSRNISDAIGYLRFLFQDGPEPVEIVNSEIDDLADRLNDIEMKIDSLPNNQPLSSKNIVTRFVTGLKKPLISNIYTVPEDKEFVLTMITVTRGPDDQSIETLGKATVWAGELSWQLDTPSVFPSGIVCPPGSTIDVRPPDRGCSPNPCGNFHCQMTGYLVDLN